MPPWHQNFTCSLLGCWVSKFTSSCSCGKHITELSSQCQDPDSNRSQMTHLKKNLSRLPPPHSLIHYDPSLGDMNDWHTTYISHLEANTNAFILKYWEVVCLCLRSIFLVIKAFVTCYSITYRGLCFQEVTKSTGSYPCFSGFPFLIFEKDGWLSILKIKAVF